MNTTTPDLTEALDLADDIHRIAQEAIAVAKQIQTKPRPIRRPTSGDPPPVWPRPPKGGKGK
jgi:hypothetical protein